MSDPRRWTAEDYDKAADMLLATAEVTVSSSALRQAAATLRRLEAIEEKARAFVNAATLTYQRQKGWNQAIAARDALVDALEEKE